MPTPITLFRKLANSAKLEFTKQNNTETSIKRHTYYFYTYLKAFLGAAAVNEGISTLNHHQAIQKITSKPTNTHHLARILTYFHLLHQPKLSITQISAEYRDKFYPQAEKIIFEKFNVQFNTTTINDDILFNTPSSSLTKNKNTKQTYADKLNSNIYTTTSHTPFQ